VKNNLQTVAALLRLQARRLRAPEARAALDEAMRRVASIAIVHETLSHAPEEIVDFDDVADRVAMMAGELSAAEIRVIPKITGSFGLLSASVATPLALVLTELLQNALQHGFPQAAKDQGLLEVAVVRDQDRLTVTVSDSGIGLPDGFDLDSATSLGLQIVRTLVVGELGGRLAITPRPGGGTEAVVDLPVGHESPRLYVRAGAEPDRAALERAPFILARPAPDAGVLPGVDRPAQAFFHHRAAAAHLFGFLDLEERRTAVPDGEEQLGVHLTAGGFVTPVHAVHSFSAAAASRRYARLSLACEVFHELCHTCSGVPSFSGLSWCRAETRTGRQATRTCPRATQVSSERITQATRPHARHHVKPLNVDWRAQGATANRPPNFNVRSITFCSRRFGRARRVTQ
jgi:two-component sensor histidine kinase